MQEVNTMPIEAEPTIENEQKSSALKILEQAKLLSINSPTDYDGAAAFTKQVKSLSKRIKDYWEPLKKSARASWQSLVDREKELLTPLEQAETEVKKKMAAYQKKVQEEERAARLLAEKLAREEAERLLQQAAEAADQGNQIESEILLAQAEVVENVQPAVQVQRPTATGVSTRTLYRAKILDESKVPVAVAGVTIRPVDLSAINKLAQASKGKLQIPGIEIYEEQSVAVRA
ncbi:MAG TPA: hypothetical protein DCZ10_12475 [Pelotomaculum sp.]|jgi:uncharacterized membrane protein YccC|uniref:Uncharacterized protein n=1 Tax=Syntrophomonas wolfei TaxID=863 RepID=A0A354YYA8_9FIRM|nr:hypothetical protein [Pelotomaculum sp.]HBK53212.1 hypothetical protein [Syntrophomonas wolfei]